MAPFETLLELPLTFGLLLPLVSTFLGVFVVFIKSFTTLNLLSTVPFLVSGNFNFLIVSSIAASLRLLLVEKSSSDISDFLTNLFNWSSTFLLISFFNLCKSPDLSIVFVLAESISTSMTLSLDIPPFSSTTCR